MKFSYKLNQEMILFENKMIMLNEEDEFILKKNLTIISTMPLLFIIIMTVPNSGGRYNGGTLICTLFLMVIMFGFNGVYRPKYNQTRENISKRVEFQELEKPVCVTIKEEKVVVERDDKQEEFDWKSLKVVLFSQDVILFVSKDNDYFSINLSDNQELEKNIKKKVKCKRFPSSEL
ncbi:MAG: hypothetical protein R3Y54_02360 [Eubacteriales bacterium]